MYEVDLIGGVAQGLLFETQVKGAVAIRLNGAAGVVAAVSRPDAADILVDIADGVLHIPGEATAAPGYVMVRVGEASFGFRVVAPKAATGPTVNGIAQGADGNIALTAADIPLGVTDAATVASALGNLGGLRVAFISEAFTPSSSLIDIYRAMPERALLAVAVTAAHPIALDEQNGLPVTPAVLIIGKVSGGDQPMGFIRLSEADVSGVGASAFYMPEIDLEANTIGWYRYAGLSV